jgi:nitrate reductase gamma subunit
MTAVQEFVLFHLHTFALGIFVVLYAIKVWQLVRLPLPQEGGPEQGNTGRAVALSYASILLPWSMESTRREWGRWLAFGVYHIAILVAILSSFAVPFLPAIMSRPVRIGAAVLIALGFVAGLLKLAWRLSRPELRLVSTPEDYFSLAILDVWFAVAVPALLLESSSWEITYFTLTSLLLIYVPLSKISHYIYWFFSRYFFGVRYGRRGVI